MNEPTRSRSIALVDVLADDRRVTQTGGFPLDPDKMLPIADVVLLLGDEDGSGMLFRYTAHGELAGDTWHLTADDAREQAEEEYGDALVPWVDVPDEVGDAHQFAIGYAFERLNSRGKW
jgi:hypothetical protein